MPAVTYFYPSEVENFLKKGSGDKEIDDLLKKVNKITDSVYFVATTTITKTSWLGLVENENKSYQLYYQVNDMECQLINLRTSTGEGSIFVFDPNSLANVQNYLMGVLNGAQAVNENIHRSLKKT